MRSRALVSAWLLVAAGWQMGALAFLLGRPAGRSWRRTAAPLGRLGALRPGGAGGAAAGAASGVDTVDALAAALGAARARGGGGGGRAGAVSMFGGRPQQYGLAHVGRVRPLCSVVEGRAEKTKASRGAVSRPAAAAAAAAVDDEDSYRDDEEDEVVDDDGEGGGEDGGDVEAAAGSAKKGGGKGSPDLSAENKRLDELEQEIWRMAGREFKITSYVELSRVLFEDLKLPVVKQPTNKVLGGYYSTSNAVLNELSAMGYELPAKVLDYRALLYLIRSKQGKKKKAAGEGKGAKAAAEAAAAEKGLGGKGERMSPEEKLMMSMLKEESGVDALDRTMERVGVDIEKVMERVQTMTTGGGLRTPGGATGEAAVEDFVPEEGGFEEPDLTEPLAVLQEEEEAEEGGELPPSLFDKSWGVANNFVLVDANSIIFRTYHAMPKLTTADGTPINAVLGFCNVLNKLLLPAMTQSRVRPYVLVVFDGHAPLHRQTSLYPNYKANRGSTPQDLIPQFPLAQEAAMAFGGINVTAPEGLEADDVIATFAQTAVEQVPDMKVTIVSSDKDFLQLVNEDITVFDPFNMARLGPNEVFEKYGLEPYQLLDYFAMVGDSADNVPGIPGIGPKTAQELLEEFESFEELWEFRDEVESPRLRKIVEENVEKFLMSRRLIRLKKLFDPPAMSLMPRAFIPEAKMAAFCERYGLKDLHQRVRTTIARAEAAKEAAALEEASGGSGPGGVGGFY